MPTKDEIHKFSMAVDSYVIENELNYIEGTVEYYQSIDLDQGTAISLMSQSLKSKIELDASRLNLVKKRGNRLPL